MWFSKCRETCLCSGCLLSGFDFPKRAVLAILQWEHKFIKQRQQQADFLSFKARRRQMAYLTSVQKTWGLCFYNVSQHSSPILFLKIYGLCVQERRWVASAVSTPPQPMPPHRDPRRRQKLQPSLLLAHAEGAGGWWLCSLGQRVPPRRMNHLTPSHSVSTSSPTRLLLAPPPNPSS